MSKLIKATDNVYYTNYTLKSHIKLAKGEIMQHTGVFHCPSSLLHGSTFVRECYIDQNRKKRFFYLEAHKVKHTFNSLKALINFYLTREDNYYENTPQE